MVLASNGNVTHEFTCDEWALLAPNSGWVVLTSNCGGNYFNANQAPYASYDLPQNQGDKNYLHDQAQPQTVWTVVHNLGKYPTATIFDTAGREWGGSITHLNNNILTITFNAAFAGKATLN